MQGKQVKGSQQKIQPHDSPRQYSKATVFPSRELIKDERLGGQDNSAIWEELSSEMVAFTGKDGKPFFLNRAIFQQETPTVSPEDLANATIVPIENV